MQNYNKINKLLRNLIIHSASTIELTQIETFVQNADSFIETVLITLKYIKANVNGENAVVPFDLVSILLDLIAKITTKSK